jgi:hypothetical protein
MNKIALVTAALAAALAAPASATNWNVFKDTPITRMSAKDLSAYKAAVIQTLDKGEDGRTVIWSGEEQGVRSQLTPLKSYEIEGLNCRDIRIETEAKELVARGTYTLCKDAKREWGFKTFPTKSTSAKPKK